jgi:hypothetical protein
MSQKYTYLMASGPGLNLGGGIGLVGAGAQAVSLFIWNKQSPQWVAEYAMGGVNAGVGKARIDIAQIWSSASEFESLLPSATLFSGTVQCVESGVNVGVGYGYQRLVWVTGLAKGAVVEGDGWSLKVSLGVTLAQSSILALRYLSTSSPMSRRAVQNTMYQPPPIRNVHGPR